MAGTLAEARPLGKSRALNQGGERHFHAYLRRPGGAASLHPDRLRRAAGRSARSAWHSAADLEHPARQHGRSPGDRVGRRALRAETSPRRVGISHVAHRNVDWRLFFRIVVPGVDRRRPGAYRQLTRDDAASAQADRARLSDRARPLPLLGAASCTAITERRPRIVRRSAWSAASSMRPAVGGWRRRSAPSSTCWSRSNPRQTPGTVNTALLILYPKLHGDRIAGSDIAHAVPLTLIAGVGHWLMGRSTSR